MQATPPSAKQLTSKDVVFESKTDKAAITSRGMYHLAYGVCTSLTRLQLVGCDSVEFEGMRFLSEHPPPRLIDLQLRNCKGVGVRVHQMMARSPFGQLQLRRLSICEDLCSVVLDGARALLAGCRCLEMFEVRSCKLLPPLEAPETQAMLRSLPSLPPLLEWYPGTTGVILTQDLW